jgi:LPPG:FO 2-phospho-L-lactate transferase
MSVRRVVALSGGVGGAKLSLGLSRVLPPRSLTIIVNTGDDFEHLGLHISPDIDTATYTLAGLENPETGWGRRDETWTFMRTLADLGGETWFRIGDGDLALHMERTRRLAGGETLSAVTADLASRLGVAATIVPVTDDRLRTRVATDVGELDFQDYFVRRQCRPAVSALRYDGAAEARLSPGAAAALAAPDLDAVIICPSNPFLSIDPMLAVPELRNALHAVRVPIIAVSPLIGGRAVKGPTAKIMAELGMPQSALEIAGHYAGIIGGFVLDECDGDLTARLGVPSLVTDTMMTTVGDKERVARRALDLAARLRPARRAT